jgi:hypothetical protein
VTGGDHVRRSERLESLGQLAGQVAHDFNNLIGAIQIYNSFVKEEVTAAADTGDPRWKTVVDDVEEIERASHRAAQLTRQLLAFARREVVRPEVLNLNDVVSDVESVVRETLGDRVVVVTSLDPELRSVVADRGQLEQVLVALAVNARDAMAEGGTLSIGTTNVDIDDEFVTHLPELEPGPHACLRVSDSGTGMDDAVRDRAFEPFFTTKSKGLGTGLGLAAVYGIVRRAGGCTEIHSEPGIGTTVTVLLPSTETTVPGRDALPGT